MDIQLTPEQEQQIEGQQNINPSTLAMKQDPAEFIQKLLENSHVPKELISKYWVLFGQSTKLTFLDDEDIRVLKLEWEILRLTIIESLPKKAYDENLEETLQQIGIEFMLNTKRSKGNRMNERELISANTNATYAENALGEQAQGKGWLSKIKGMFSR